MEASVKIIKNLRGEFVEAAQVKFSNQFNKDRRYQSSWNMEVDRFSNLNARFFKTPGTIYPFDYYVIYVADGMRFLKQLSYCSSLTNGGFAYGFFTEGIKNQETLELVAKHPELKGIEEDSLTILVSSEGRVGTHGKARNYMREQTRDLQNRFFTKEF